MNTDALWFFRLFTKQGGFLVGLFLLVGIFFFTNPPSAYSVPGAWYDEEFHRLLTKHHCQELTIYQKTFPFFQLWTDEVFAAWCRDAVQENASYVRFHLIVIPRSSTHPWAGCPRFLKLDSSAPLYIWMERPTLKYGRPTTLGDLIYETEHGQPLKPGPSEIQAAGPSLWIGLPTDVASLQ